MNNVVEPTSIAQSSENQDTTFDELDKLLDLVKDDVPTDPQQILETLFSVIKD